MDVGGGLFHRGWELQPVLALKSRGGSFLGGPAQEVVTITLVCLRCQLQPRPWKAPGRELRWRHREGHVGWFAICLVLVQPWVGASQPHGVGTPMAVLAGTSTRGKVSLLVAQAPWSALPPKTWMPCPAQVLSVWRLGCFILLWWGWRLGSIGERWGYVLT